MSPRTSFPVLLSKRRDILSLGGALLLAAISVGAEAATDNASMLVMPPPPSAATADQAKPDTKTDAAKGIPIQAPAPSAADPTASNAADVSAAALSLEDQARKAQDESNQIKIKREEEHSIESFDRAAAGLMPMSDEQIRTFLRKMENTQDASQMPSSGPPKGQVRIVNLQLDPGATPPQINLAPNYVTTIDILDSSGAPWPILDVGIGGSFEVSPTQAGSHVVRVMPLARVADGNLSVLLKDLPTPVIFRLSSGGPSVDLRSEVRVPKYGPNARVPLVNHPTQIQAGDESLLAILQNAPPSNAKRLKISGLDARTMAWNNGIHTYVRTPLTLLSPSWSASVSSGDGMNVYEIGDAPVLLMSDNGAMIRAHVLRDDNHDK